MKKVNLIPMAGSGQRFIDEGYTIPKPLLNVDGLPMVIRAAKCLPDADLWIFICRTEHIVDYGIDNELKKHFSNAEIIQVNYKTEGQASTCMLAKDLLSGDDQLTIGSCDNGMNINLEVFKKLSKSCDALIWTFRNQITVLDNPKMYGWVLVDEDGTAVSVSCKEPISDNPLLDHCVVGAFSFRKASTFFNCVEIMIKKNRRINNEFYMDVALDECIQLGFDVRPMEITSYTCWGTPKDLEVYINKQLR